MLNVGLDIGNGYVKGLLKNPDHDKKAQAVDLMSDAVSFRPSDKIVKITDPAAIEREMGDIYDMAELSFDSPLITGEEGFHYFVGKRAERSGLTLMEFNLKEARRAKSEDKLSAILTLSVLACKTLKEYYEKNGRLPEREEILNVDVNMAMSVPIGEYRSKRDVLVRKYENRPHLVVIHNFQYAVRVEIHVKKVVPAAEGASAQFAIARKGEKFIAALVADMEKHGVKLREGITVSDISKAGGVVGVDIGEGTVNFPVYQDLRFNADISDTFNQGYGTVLDKAAKTLTDMGRPFKNSRKVLMGWLLDAKDRPMKKPQYDEAMRVVNDEIVSFTDEVKKQFMSILEVNGSYTEVVYIYGGGATPMQWCLYDKLIDALNSSLGEGSFVALYLDSSYSRYLNRDGLYLLAASDDANTEDLNNL